MVSSTDSTDDSIYVPPKKSYNKTVILTPNDFKVKRLIGRGAFGEVRVCRNRKTQEVVAIKKMKKTEMIYKN